MRSCIIANVLHIECVSLSYLGGICDYSVFLIPSGLLLLLILDHLEYLILVLRKISLGASESIL